jgi:heptosyltransferase-2
VNWLLGLAKSVKKSFWRTLANLVGNKPADLPLDFTKIRSVLVIRPDRLGDLILSTPVYASLKLSFPGIKINVLANRSSSDILSDNPHVDRVIAFDKKKPWRILRDLKSGEFDLAIVLNRMFSSTAATFALLSGAGLRLGYNTREGAGIFNIAVEGSKNAQHEIQNNLDLLRHIGVTTLHENPGIYFTAEETQKVKNLIKTMHRFPGRPLALIKPGTRVPAWGWKLDKFQTVCRNLLESQLAEVFIIQGPGEENMIDSLFRATGPSPVILPMLSTKELACMIANSQLLLCNHTGIMHMASAVQTPVVAIFKHGDTIRWGPCNTSYKILEERNNDALSTDQTLEAIKVILKKPE